MKQQVILVRRALYEMRHLIATSLLDMVCVALSLGACSCTRTAHGDCGSSITQEFSHEIRSANHVTDARGGDEPTLVMGASIVMEWIRAIEECLRCELPVRMKKTKKKKNISE